VRSSHTLQTTNYKPDTPHLTIHPLTQLDHAVIKDTITHPEIASDSDSSSLEEGLKREPIEAMALRIHEVVIGEGDAVGLSGRLVESRLSGCLVSP
jgi:hypothetical protein